MLACDSSDKDKGKNNKDKGKNNKDRLVRFLFLFPKLPHGKSYGHKLTYE